MRLLGVAASFTLLLAALGCSKPTPGPAATENAALPTSRAAANAPNAPNAPNAGVGKSGKVVGRKSGQPLAGVSVALGDSVRLTDAEGRFEVPAGNGPYDVVLMSADRALIAVYLGIVRRDPVLRQLEPEQPEPRAHHAEIRGTLSGVSGDPQWGDAVQVGFFSERAHVEDNAHRASTAATVEYGPLVVSWDGPDVLSGQLLALQMVRGSSLSATVANSALRLRGGHGHSLRQRLRASARFHEGSRALQRVAPGLRRRPTPRAEAADAAAASFIANAVKRSARLT